MPVYRDEIHKTYYVKFGYKDWKGEYRQTTKRGFALARDAKKYETAFKEKLAGQPNMTLKSLYEKYIADLSVHAKKSTVRGRKSKLEKHLVPMLGDMKIGDITPAVVREWQNKITAYISPRTNKTMSPATVRTINSQFSTIMNYAVHYYNLKSNPVAAAGSVGKKNYKEMDFWEKEEFDLFIAGVDNIVWKVIFLVLFYGGIRPGELLCLEESDLSFVASTISISKTLDYMGGNDEETEPKTPSAKRIIPMPHFIMDLIKEYINRMAEKTDKVFPQNYRTIDYNFQKYTKKAGVKRIRLYDLRHSHVSHLISLGIPITAISKRVGHKSPKITLETYSHMYQKDSDNIAKILDKIEKSGQNTVREHYPQQKAVDL